MKFFTISFISIALVLISYQCEARIDFASNENILKEKRFLGSIGSWITDNIVNPITDNVINPITDGIDSVIGTIDNFVQETIINGGSNLINTIADPFVNFGNMIQSLAGTISNTLNDAVNDSINFLKDQTLGVVVLVSSLIFQNGGNQPGAQDACKLTCFSKVSFNSEPITYYFDRPNGCISKGFNDPNLDIFNNCCDKHNECLNAKCCTDNCQELKNECDAEFEKCNKEVCLPLFLDNMKFYPCLARGAFIASASVNRTCNQASSTNRKTCFCHIKDL